MARRHLRFKVVGTPVTELKLVDLGEVTHKTSGDVSSGKFEISSGKFEIVSTGKFEIVVEDEGKK
jgi:hypothetical protein